jgi:hypothetical protein
MVAARSKTPSAIVVYLSLDAREFLKKQAFNFDHRGR